MYRNNISHKEINRSLLLGEIVATLLYILGKKTSDLMPKRISVFSKSFLNFYGELLKVLPSKEEVRSLLDTKVQELSKEADNSKDTSSLHDVDGDSQYRAAFYIVGENPVCPDDLNCSHRDAKEYFEKELGRFKKELEHPMSVYNDKIFNDYCKNSIEFLYKLEWEIKKMKAVHRRLFPREDSVFKAPVLIWRVIGDKVFHEVSINAKQIWQKCPVCGTVCKDMLHHLIVHEVQLV